MVRGQQGELLSMLVCAHPNPVPRDALIDALWGEDAPRTAATGLRVAITRLREKLGTNIVDDPVPSEGRGYRLALPSETLDVYLFDTKIQRARVDAETTEGVRLAHAVHELRDALTLWQGEPFAPFDGGGHLDPTIRRLEEQREGAEELLVRALLDLGHVDEAVARATKLTKADGLRENRWALLMSALYRAGRQADALRAFQDAARLLGEELGLTPGPALIEMERRVLSQDPTLLGNEPAESSEHSTPLTSSAARTASLDDLIQTLRSETPTVEAPTTSFFGRDDELEQLDSLLRDQSMVTLIGPPGVGKTRLAAHIARGTRDRRVLWVDLVQQVDSVVEELADQLSIMAPPEGLASAVAVALRSAPSLLVLDNCERDADTAGRIAEALVRSCPTLAILATSRVVLANDSEQLFDVRPLAAADGRRLLLERAFGTGERPTLDHSSVSHVAERLDHLPLALELVAGVVRHQGLHAVTEHLDDLLNDHVAEQRSDTRHSNLNSAIAWSAELLDTDTQRALDGLGVTNGPFRSTEFAAMLGVSDEEAHRQISTLVDHSLLARRHDGSGVEFRALQTVRQHARQRLQTSGALQDMARRHAKAYLGLVEWAIPRWRDDRELTAVTRVGSAGGQLRAAFDWSMQSEDLATASALAVGIWDHAFLRMERSQRSLPLLLAQSTVVDDLPNAPDVLGTMAMAAWTQGDLNRSAAYASKAFDAASQLGLPPPLRALQARFNEAGYNQRNQVAEEALTSILDSVRRPELEWDHSAALVSVVLALAHLGQHAEARSVATRSVEKAENTGSPSARAYAQYAIGLCTIQDDPRRSLSTLRESARLASTVRSRWVQGLAIDGMVTAHRRLGDTVSAAALLRDLIPHWQLGAQDPSVAASCREAALVCAEADQPHLAQEVATLARSLGSHHPLPPSDAQAFDGLSVAETTMASSDGASPIPTTPEDRVGRVLELLERVVSEGANDLR